MKFDNDINDSSATIEESDMTGQDEKRIFWQTSIKIRRPHLNAQINITITTHKSWPKNDRLGKQIYNFWELEHYLEFNKVFAW